MTMHLTRHMARNARLLLGPVLALGLTILPGGQPPDAQASHGFSHATVKVWDTTVLTSASISPGLTPGPSVEDPLNLTGHGTSSPTIVTVFGQSSHPFGPSGVSYWNPDTNRFVWYGRALGIPGGVDINRRGPVQPAESDVFGSFAFGPGDVWIAGAQSVAGYVHIAGSNKFRSYGTFSKVAPASTKTWGVKVDETTGHVFGAKPFDGAIVRLNPVTSEIVTWHVGGAPAGVAVDSAGRPYSTRSDSDIVFRVDPGDDGLLGSGDDLATFWRVPNLGGVRSFRDVLLVPVPAEYPNGIIATDPGGNIWFTQSNSDEIGRLSAGPDGVLGSPDDEICEYTKPGLANPQQIASTGSGSRLQVFFTEGEGNSVSILTPAEADTAGTPVCTPVPAETVDLPGVPGITDFFDEEVAPLDTSILPTIHDVPGTDSSASGNTLDAEGNPIPPILRFSPMPNPIPASAASNGFPSGMTGVYSGTRVAGAYLEGNKVFQLESPALLPKSVPFGSALKLDGIDDYAEIADNATVDLGTADGADFTIEAFFYVPDEASDADQVIVWKQHAYALSINFNPTTPDGIVFRWWSPDLLPDTIAGSKDLTIGWHHVSAVFDNEWSPENDRVAIYIDGIEVIGTTAIDLTPGVNDSTTPLHVGANFGAAPFVGWLDEIRFSDIVRYSGPYTVPSSPFSPDGNTRALWHFDEAAGSTSFADSSANGNTLTGQNGAQTGVP